MVVIYVWHSFATLTYGPDPPLGQVPLVPRLFVFHGVSVQGQPAHVGWLHEPEVERGGGHPVQDGLCRAVRVGHQLFIIYWPAELLWVPGPEWARLSDLLTPAGSPLCRRSHQNICRTAEILQGRWEVRCRELWSSCHGLLSQSQGFCTTSWWWHWGFPWLKVKYNHYPELNVVANLDSLSSLIFDPKTIPWQWLGPRM